MPHPESLERVTEPEGTPPLGLKPFEVGETDNGFVACLPAYGVRDKDGKEKTLGYWEKSFTTEEEAYQAVRAEKERLGLAGGMN